MTQGSGMTSGHRLAGPELVPLSMCLCPCCVYVRDCVCASPAHLPLPPPPLSSRTFPSAHTGQWAVGILSMRVQQGCPEGPSPQLLPPPHFSITLMAGTAATDTRAVCHSSVLFRWGGSVRYWGSAQSSQGCHYCPLRAISISRILSSASFTLRSRYDFFCCKAETRGKSGSPQPCQHKPWVPGPKATQAELWVLPGAPTTLQVSHGGTAVMHCQGNRAIYTN